MHTDIITCNTEEPQQKYSLGTASERLLGEGGSKHLFCTLNFTNCIFMIHLLKWQQATVSHE